MRLPKELEEKCLALAVPAKRKPVTRPPSYLIVLEDWHPARLNELMAGHWSNCHRRKKADRERIARAALCQAVPKAAGKRRVSLHIVLGPRQRGGDPDAYWKSVLDALVSAGLLVDDNRQHCELGPVTFDRDKKKATGITLEDLE